MNNEILTKAILAKVSISCFNPRRTDATVTSEVLADRSAQRGAGVWMKNLIDPSALDAITKEASTARLTHYKLSLPWSDEGFRILPITTYMVYQQEMRNHRRQFESQVETFLARWPDYVSEARIALNGMYKPTEYPTIDQVRTKFGFYLDFIPLPNGDDFRINIATEDLEAMKRDVNNLLISAQENAMKDLANRLATPIKHMAERLTKSDGIFRDSLINNIKEIVEMIPYLNLTNDPTLEILRKEAESKLLKHDPETLRINKNLRRDIAAEADAILKKLEGYIK